MNRLRYDSNLHKYLFLSIRSRSLKASYRLRKGMTPTEVLSYDSDLHRYLYKDLSTLLRRYWKRKDSGMKDSLTFDSELHRYLYRELSNRLHKRNYKYKPFGEYSEVKKLTVLLKQELKND